MFKKIFSRDKVTYGQELIKFDLDKVKNTSKSIITPIIITNTHKIKIINILQKANVSVGDDFIYIQSGINI